MDPLLLNYIDQTPAIDRRPKLSEIALATRLQDKMPNLPILYWQQHKDKKMAVNSTCAKFPSVLDLHFNNRYWQQVETSNGTFLLYGAYLDVRPNNRLGPTVRILGMIDRIEPKVGISVICFYHNPTSGQDLLPAVVPILVHANHLPGFGIQIHLVQEMGKL